MKNIFYFLMVSAWLIYPALSLAQNWSGNVNLFLGSKALDKDDWEPAEDHDEVGVLLDFKQNTWPVSIAIDILQSEGDELAFEPFSGLFINFEGETTELNLGVRKILGKSSSARPYVGGGLAFISAELKGSALGITVSDDDDAVGFWINAGIYWTLRSAFNIGLDLRYSKAEVTLFGIDAEAGGGHAGLLIGYHW